MKVKNDHRSKFSNLSNLKEEAWKNGVTEYVDKNELMETLSYSKKLLMSSRDYFDQYYYNVNGVCSHVCTILSVYKINIKTTW